MSGARAAPALIAALALVTAAAAPPARPAHAVAPILDSFMPAAHFRETHAERIHATPRQIFAAVHTVTPDEVRGLVPLLRVKSGFRFTAEEEALRRRPMLQGMAHEAVFVLGERYGDELVVGAIGRFWENRIVEFEGAPGFRAFRDPRYAKLAMNVTARDAGAGWSVVTTETRVRCDDANTRQSFERYWNLSRPGTNALRDEWLRAVRLRAESAAASHRGS